MNDNSEPLTEEWLQSIGRYGRSHISGRFYLDAYNSGWSIVSENPAEYYGWCEELDINKPLNRGQARDIFRMLGIRTAEQPPMPEESK